MADDQICIAGVVKIKKRRFWVQQDINLRMGAVKAIIVTRISAAEIEGQAFAL